MHAKYIDIPENVNTEFILQYQFILQDADIFPLNKLLALALLMGQLRIRRQPQGGCMSTVTTILDPKILFDRWFSDAIAQLEKLENGDGGTAGMMVVLPLYERYIYILKARGAKGRSFHEVMASDLHLANPSEAETFWMTFRHGFCHTGMPFERARDGNALPKVSFSGRFSWRPEFHTAPDGQRTVCLDPWKFIHYVMDKYRDDPTLLTQYPDAPLLAIHVLT